MAFYAFRNSSIFDGQENHSLQFFFLLMKIQVPWRARLYTLQPMWIILTHLKTNTNNDIVLILYFYYLIICSKS